MYNGVFSKFKTLLSFLNVELQNEIFTKNTNHESPMSLYTSQSCLKTEGEPNLYPEVQDLPKSSQK